MNFWAIVLCHKLEHYVDRAIASVVTQSRKPTGIILAGTDCREETHCAFSHWMRSTHEELLYARFTQAPMTCRQSKAWSVKQLPPDADAFFILDADDTIDERFIELCGGMMESSGADAVGCQYEIALESGRKVPAFLPSQSKTDFRTANPMPCVSITRRTAYESVGGYNEDGSKFEDWCLWIRMHKAGKSLIRHPMSLFTYRRHAGNITNGYDGMGEILRTREYFDSLNIVP